MLSDQVKRALQDTIEELGYINLDEGKNESREVPGCDIEVVSRSIALNLSNNGLFLTADYEAMSIILTVLAIGSDMIKADIASAAEGLEMFEVSKIIFGPHAIQRSREAIQALRDQVIPHLNQRLANAEAKLTSKSEASSPVSSPKL